MKITTSLPQICLAAVLTFLISPALIAQQPAAETLQQRLPATPGAAPLSSLPSAITTNSDLGQIAIVQQFPKPPTLTFSTSQQFFYTDNVFYTNDHEATIGSLGYLGSYTGSWVPYSLRDWTPRISAQWNMVRYGSAAAGDFDNENIAVSSQYVFGDDRTWTWTTSATIANFTDPHNNDHQFYKEVVYDNQISNVQHPFKDVPLYFIAAYDIAYHQASPAIFDRLDNSLDFSCAYYPVPELSIGPYVRPCARTYFNNGTYLINGDFGSGLVQNDRDDFNLAVGFDVTYAPCNWFSISADFNHVDDYSNNSSLSYSDTTPGLTFTGTIRF
ncbi:MAG: hypothetical protein LV481_02305 [Methylacidiphilales bacterium]|nr:hypothetical protein [Candidatus Methylacidiphilales bacterium]